MYVHATLCPTEAQPPIKVPAGTPPVTKPHLVERPEEDVQQLLNQLARSVTVRTTKVQPGVKVCGCSFQW